MGLFKYFSKEIPKDEKDLAAKAFDATPEQVSELAILPRPDYPKKRHNPPMREALNLEETKYFLQNLAGTYSSFELKHLEDGICGVVSDQVIDDFLKNELERRNLEAKLADKPTKEWTPQDKETIREYLKHVTPLLRLEMKEMYTRPWNCAGKGLVAGIVSFMGSVSTFLVYNGGKDPTEPQTAFIVGASSIFGIISIGYFDHKSKKDFQKKWKNATIKYAKKLGAE